jgi:hypothetical protein
VWNRAKHLVKTVLSDVKREYLIQWQSGWCICVLAKHRLEPCGYSLTNIVGIIPAISPRASIFISASRTHASTGRGCRAREGHPPPFCWPCDACRPRSWCRTRRPASCSLCADALPWPCHGGHVPVHATTFHRGKLPHVTFNRRAWGALIDESVEGCECPRKLRLDYRHWRDSEVLFATLQEAAKMRGLHSAVAALAALVQSHPHRLRAYSWRGQKLGTQLTSWCDCAIGTREGDSEEAHHAAERRSAAATRAKKRAQPFRQTSTDCFVDCLCPARNIAHGGGDGRDGMQGTKLWWAERSSETPQCALRCTHGDGATRGRRERFNGHEEGKLVRSKVAQQEPV